MSSNADHVVAMENVKVHFKNERLFGLMGSETVHAVDDVSLKISENDVVALVGESGCGKTTLGKTAIGVQRPTSGSVTYRGQDIWEAKDRQGALRGNGDSDAIPFTEIRRSLQMIHQDPGSSLNSNYTVESILSDPLKKWQPNLTREDRQARIFGLLEYVGMAPPGDYATRYPHQLSGGEQQRVALIRALMMNADLILADEAISALDVSLRVEMMDLLIELQDQFNTSYLFISHDLSNAKYLTEKADGRIGIMYLGELVELGPVEEIINNPQHPYTKVLLWATSDLRNPGKLGDPPVRKIDVPDPADPPSGCRFHTRCPKAREVCTRESPKLPKGDHRTACFRERENHEYWNSDDVVDDEPEFSMTTR
jgi:peptide/nickel transport system ATP-binding protein